MYLVLREHARAWAVVERMQSRAGRVQQTLFLRGMVGGQQGGERVQVLHVLEAVSQIAEERVVEVFEHAAFSDNVAHALGAHDCG